MKSIIMSVSLILLGSFFSTSLTGCDGKDSKTKYQHPLHRTDTKNK